MIHISSLSNSHNNVASIQKNRGDKSHRVIVALRDLEAVNQNVGSESEKVSEGKIQNSSMLVVRARQNSLSIILASFRTLI